MRLLLDTHIAIWAIEDNPRLSQKARDLICDPKAVVAYGVVSLWEIAIKHALSRSGPPAMPLAAADARRFFLASGYAEIPIEAEHVLSVETLAPHHTDPFDRLLVATALSEPFRLITDDQRLAAYSDTVVVV